MRRVSAACLVLVGIFVLAPEVASAQATITGIVKDASGSVLPGVTVEAASPDLIERSAPPPLTPTVLTASVASAARRTA